MSAEQDVLSERDALLKLFDHVSEEIRHRREPEYVFTATSVGSFGAVAWGVAALPSRSAGSIVAAVGVVAIVITVCVKIAREHQNYVKLRSQQKALADKLFSEATRELVTGLDGKVGRGHGLSLAIVIVSGLAAALFCLVR